MLSREEFVDGCRLMCFALERACEMKENDGTDENYCHANKEKYNDSKESHIPKNQLLDWKPVEIEDADYYLEHTPILRQQITGSKQQESQEAIEEDTYGILSDDALLDVNEKDKEKLVEWVFSIVYNDTYRVPVLFFRVQYEDGQHINHWNQEGADSLDLGIGNTKENFISEEEHPVTGIPSLFIHSCDFSSHWIDIEKVSKRNPALKIWSWLSVVLNHSKDFEMTSSTYSKVESIIEGLLDNM